MRSSILNNTQTKAVVTVAEMARMCGLSRSRFYQLQRDGVFPPPCFSVSNRRPIYMEDQQQVCLEVRRRNCGINGQPVLFYARRLDLATPPPRSRPTARPKSSPHAELVESIKALGIEVTPQKVEAALRVLYPSGINGVDQGSIIRSVFRHLRQSDRQYKGDSVG